MLTEEDFTNPYTLSRLADCATPDNKQSPGAVFLLDVADDYQNRADAYGDTDPDDLPFTIADDACYNAESRGTHGFILAAVDLCAYQEDVDHGDPNATAHSILTAAMFQIAARLIQALQAEDI